MTSAAWQNAVLVCIIVAWAVMIAQTFGIIVGLILANAKAIRNAVRELGAHFPRGLATVGPHIPSEACFLPISRRRARIAARHEGSWAAKRLKRIMIYNNIL